MNRKGIVQSLVLAGLLTVGFTAVWGVISFWALEVGTHVVAGITPQAVMFEISENLGFLSDGTPVIASRQGGQQRRLHDLQGNPVDEPDAEHPFMRLAALPSRSNADEAADWEQRIHSFADGRVPSGYWYFIADGRHEGSGYFVGYDSESHTCLGYLGLAGVCEEQPPPQDLIPFAGLASGPKGRLYCIQPARGPADHPQRGNAARAPHGSVSTWDVYVLGRDARLYHVDLQKRIIHVAFDSAPVLSAVLTAGVPDGIRGTPFRPTVRTEDAVLILDERGQVRKRYPIPQQLRGQDLSFGETSSGEAVMYANSPEDILAMQVEYHICRVDPSGRCWQTTTVLPFAGVKRLVPMAGFVIPSPVFLAGIVAAGRAPMLRDDGLAATYREALSQALREFWLPLVVAQMIAFSCAVLCYRRQVRSGVSRTERIVWPLFVLLLGLPGWIGYRFGRSWPVLESCPECGRVVPRDRESCVRCANDFPHPALKGTEVFA